MGNNKPSLKPLRTKLAQFRRYDGLRVSVIQLYSWMLKIKLKVNWIFPSLLKKFLPKFHVFLLFFHVYFFPNFPPSFSTDHESDPTSTFSSQRERSSCKRVNEREKIDMISHARHHVYTRTKKGRKVIGWDNEREERRLDEIYFLHSS